MKRLWIYGPRLVLSLLVLWAGWGAMTIFLGGWRSLVEEPAPTLDVTSAEPASGLTTEALLGGSWRFAGIPWSVRFERRESAQPPDASELVQAANHGETRSGVPLQPRHREALRALTFLGATERTLSEGRLLWTLHRERVRATLLLADSVEGTTLLGGMLGRFDAQRNVWTAHALVPLVGETLPEAFLIPESAHPTRIASRCDAEGRTLLEIALVPPGDFTVRRVSPNSGSSPETDSGGLRSLDQRTEAGRTITYLRGPDRNGEPILVVATAFEAREPESQSSTGN